MRGWIQLVAVSFALACLAACGGGGSGSAAPPTPATSISLTVSNVQVTGTRKHATPSAQFFVSVLNISDNLYLDVDHSSIGVEDVSIGFTSNVQARVAVSFRSPDDLAVGTHNDTITVRVCYEPQCNRHVLGSPATVPVNYTVLGRMFAPEPGLPVLPTQSRVELAHDVLSAEYSNSLDAIVMVSSDPEHVLILLDPVSGMRREVPLSKAPTSLSLAPDGLAAAVGHDGLVSYVDLAELVQAGVTAPIELDLSISAFDLVLDGRGFVHVIPGSSGWPSVHSIEIATNTETRGGFSSTQQHARLHPSGDSIYAVGVFTGSVQKYDISSGSAQYLYSTPGVGEFSACHNLWISADGETIDTACGHVFQSSSVQSEDMVPKGRLALSDSDFGFRISHLSRFDPMNEIMLVESDWYICTTSEPDCWSHLALYQGDSLARTALFSIPTINIDGNDYKQVGLYAFHSADGLRRYLISHAPWGPGSPYYFSVLQ
jgi:hypothetical protein